MKERPILFSAPMVQAILDGTKTQTRRVIKVQPSTNEHQLATCIDTTGARKNKGKHHWVKINELNVEHDDNVHFSSPYGYAGDQLWVRENFQPLLEDGKTWDDMPHVNYKTGEGYAISYPATDGIVEFVNTDDEIKDSVKPSIYMPRWASRIQLEITNVRVERLRDISETDAIAEGIERVGGNASVTPWRNYRIGQEGEMQLHCSAPSRSYMTLWESINGAGSWQANPWVWVVEFKVIKP